MGTNAATAATLEIEFVARATTLEAQMAALRQSVANDVGDLDKRMRKLGNFDPIPIAPFKKAGAAVNSLAGQTSNMSAQFSDFFIQVQGGSSVMTAALQQGSQLGAVLSGAGGVGAAARGVGAAFMSMLSPVNLATIGLLAASGAAAKYFLAGHDGAEQLTEALKRQPEIINAIRDAWGDAAAKAADYQHESSGVVAAKVKEQADTLGTAISAAAAAASEAVRRGLEGLRVDTSGLAMPELADLGRSNDVAGINALQDAVDDLDRSISEGKPNLLKFREALSAIVTSRDASEDVRTLASALLAQTQAAADASRALNGLSAAQAAVVDSTRTMVAETKTFNTLMTQGLFQEAAQHAQTLGQALTAAAAAQKALNAQAKRMDPDSFGPGDLGYFPGTNPNDPRLSGAQMRGIASRWAGREDRVFPEQIFSPSSSILDLIAQAEGTSARRNYNETLDFGKWTGGDRNLTAMTLNEILDLQRQMLANPDNRALYGNGSGSSALGRYQITRQTLQDLMGRLGLTGTEYFSPDMQDRLAQELIRQSGGDVGKLQGRWAGLSAVPASTISTSLGNSQMAGQDSAIASQQRAYEEMIRSGHLYIAEQQQEAAQIGMTAEQSAKLRYEQQMLNQLTASGVPATEAQKEAISQLATEMAAAETAAQRLGAAQQEAMSLGMDVTKGFVSDLVNGKSAAEAFADALGKIGEKLLDMAINDMFTGGSSLSGLFGFIGSLFGGGSSGPLDLGSFLKNAKGGVYASPSLSAYSGRVVDRPTLFAFAKGAGLMGEAGAEAIMPLTRDASGRLGVRASGAGGGDGGRAITINVVGATGNSEIRDMVASGITAGLKDYDRAVLPSRVSYLNSHPRKR
jgi:hypothetical protein